MSYETPTPPDKYVYLDQAAVYVSNALGIDIPERHINKISKSIGITPFKVGNRIAFSSGAFEKKFDLFVRKSAAQLEAQTYNRTAGAVKFNDKIDGVFAYLAYANDEGEVFSYTSCVDYLKSLDSSIYGTWTEDYIKGFIQARIERRRNSALGERVSFFRSKDTTILEKQLENKTE